jgi:hypothetical protein
MQRAPAQPMPPPPPPPPLYRSAAAEARFSLLYTQALQALPFPHEERLVQTPSFGSVHVTVCGPRGALPLLLWHGTAAPGPFMLPALEPLVERCRVFVPDIPCQGEPAPASRFDPPGGTQVWHLAAAVPAAIFRQALTVADRAVP